MADSKLHGGDLDTQTGAALATGDYFYGVDISNTSGTHSDANGNSVKMTAGELKIGLATTLGLVGIDKIFDAAGDVIIGTGADTSSVLTISTTAGAALCADPNAANKISYQYPQAVDSAARGMSGSVASTYDRRSIASNVAIVAAASGTLRLYAIMLPKGLSVNNISFTSGTTAGGTLTHQWFGLFDSSRVVLAKTADDTSTAWPATTTKTLAVTGGPFVTTYAGWYYIGPLVTATTVPTIEGLSGLTTTGVRNMALIPSGTSTTGLTDPASCTGTQTALTALGSVAYAEIS